MITITQKEALNIESQTKNQTKSCKWYELRAGRITASVMKEAISTKIESPSLSLIKKICCRCKFGNVATDWGIEHEKPAKDCYFIQNSKNHSNFTIRESGLVINPKWSYIGASPDGIVRCSYCGERCSEIKCPYSDKELYN